MAVGLTMPAFPRLTDLIDKAVEVYVGNYESAEHLTYALAKFVGDCFLAFPTYNTALKAMGKL